MNLREADWEVKEIDGETWIVDAQGLFIARVFAVGEVLGRPDWRKRVNAVAQRLAAAPALLRELSHLVRLLEPLEQSGTLHVPGLATLNGARAALARVPEEEEASDADF